MEGEELFDNPGIGAALWHVPCLSQRERGADRGHHTHYSLHAGAAGAASCQRRPRGGAWAFRAQCEGLKFKLKFDDLCAGAASWHRENLV